jgi:cysteinyl-tRNA synthetase
MKLYLHNTLTLKKEEFKEIKKGKVGIYSCGPTVYNYAHLGNLRAYLFVDLLKRVLIYNNYQVKHVMNITDVGHLSGDMDMGDDKVESQAKKEKKDAWQIADYYTKAFQEDLKHLNILAPDIWAKVSDHIDKQIELIEILEKKGFTYKTSDGIYFDTSLVKDYNKLSHLPLETLKEGARVEKNIEKKSPTDFALWKFSPKNKKRQMEWSSPWGIGFPGWHIECSALSRQFLGELRDIHSGGIDHINIHHTNEIAQSECAYGEKYFNYWLHNAFLNIVGGKKMAKSEDNFLTLKKAIINQGINPLVYRLASLQVHYRKNMEFSLFSLKNLESSLNKLYQQVDRIKKEAKQLGEINNVKREEFILALNDDLNSPQALAVLNELIKSQKIKNEDKLATLYDFDRVLGLNLSQAHRYLKKEVKISNLSPALKDLLNKRKLAKEKKDYSQADLIREKIKVLGYEIEDKGAKQTVYEK